MMSRNLQRKFYVENFVTKKLNRIFYAGDDEYDADSYAGPPRGLDEVLDRLGQQESCGIQTSFSTATRVLVGKAEGTNRWALARISFIQLPKPKKGHPGRVNPTSSCTVLINPNPSIAETSETKIFADLEIIILDEMDVAELPSSRAEVDFLGCKC
jgi:hypothetical protein